MRSGAKLRPHKEQPTKPSFPPPGPVAKIDFRGIVVPLAAEVGGDSTSTGFGANFGFVADGPVSFAALEEEDFYHRTRSITLRTTYILKI